MAFADNKVCFPPLGDGSIIGSFREKTKGNMFEFSENPNLESEPEFPHLIWVSTPIEGVDCGYRKGEVKKTVAKIAVDEDDNGYIIEKWDVKEHRVYPRPENNSEFKLKM